MRKVLLVGLALFLAFVSSARAGNLVVKAGRNAYVRSGPQEFVIGTLFAGQGFYNFQNSNSPPGYHFGYAAGSYGGSGWILDGDLTPGGRTPAIGPRSGFQGHGVAARQYLLANYARTVNDYVPGANPPLPLHGFGNGVHLTSAGNVYGNYRGGRHLNLEAGLNAGQFVFWRYVTKDGHSVLVELNQAGSGFWGFIPRGHLPAQLPYSDGRHR